MATIGTGFYAKVVGATTADTAIKIIPCRYFASAIREYTLVSACRHPAIIQFNAIGCESQDIKLSMHKYPTDLDKLIKAGPILPENYAKMSHDLLSAVAYLHSRGIIHSDIKPSNLLVTKDLGLVLADFGISLMADEPNHNTYIQSPAYRAPEVNYGRSKSSFDQRADNWSIGCTLFEIITGKDFVAPDDTWDDATLHICAAFGLPVFKHRTDRIKILDFLCPDFVRRHIFTRIPAGYPAEHVDLMCKFLIPNRCKRMTPACALALRGQRIIVEKIRIPSHDPTSMGVIVGIDRNVIARVTFDCLCLAEEIYMHARVIDSPVFVRLAAIYIAVCLHSSITPLDDYLKEKRLYIEVISVVMKMLPGLSDLFFRRDEIMALMARKIV